MSIKRLARLATGHLVKLVGKTGAGKYVLDLIVATAMTNISSVRHGELVLQLATPNWLNRWRAATFSAKEPETLEWIDTIPEGSVLWDVGANVGLYSVYAAKQRKCKVFAFEPSVFNLELLARNIYLNHVADSVCIVPIPLTNRTGTEMMHLSTTDWGGALSTFGNNLGWDGNPLREVFAFRTIGLSMIDCVDSLRLPSPDFIKMDVDGIEHIILEGGGRILGNIKGILIEVNDGFKEQADKVAHYLTIAGLRLRQKRQSELVAQSGVDFSTTFNQVWGRG